MSQDRPTSNPARFVFHLSQQDAAYLLNLMSADLVALKGSANQKLRLRALSVRDRLCRVIRETTGPDSVNALRRSK